MRRHDRSEPARRGSRAMVLLLVLIGAASGLVGAASASEKEKRKDHEGATLSDAAKETAKAPDQQRTLRADDSRGGDQGSSLDILFLGSDDDSPGPSMRGLVHALHVGAAAEAVSLSSPDFATSTLYGIRVGISDHRHTSLDLALLGGAARFTPGSDIAARFRAPSEVAIDASLRYSLTPMGATFGVAPVVGLRAGWLSWNYQNGIWLERDGGVFQVSDDGVDHYSPYLGVAATFLHTRHVELCVTGVVGLRFYGSHTDAGLRNDLFGQDRFSEVRLETRFGL